MGSLILLVLSLVLFLLAGVRLEHPRIHLGWFGMAALVGSFILQHHS